jgi:broad specificity phosphatase PhoE
MKNYEKVISNNSDHIRERIVQKPRVVCPEKPVSVVNNPKERTTMTDTLTDIHVWFLRHGKTPFNYENSNYDDFIQMLCNGYDTPLAEDPGIDFTSLPKRVDFVGYSPIKRSVETAKVLRKKLGVELMEELELLREVRFDYNIIARQEYTSLANSREVILKRWYSGRNEAETFEDSLARVRKIESVLSERQEKTIILVSHGWFLRLLEIYFVQGKHTDITLKDILETQPVPLGHSIKATIKATVARKNSVNSKSKQLVGA